MIIYSSLDDSTKQKLKEQIESCALSIGGKNHFLYNQDSLPLVVYVKGWDSGLAPPHRFY